jgi:RNA polymerase sigma factor (sigma-70 family)
MATDNETDLSLIQECISGENKAAWEEFVKKYSKLIWNSIHKTFRRYSFQYTPEDSEDMYSAIFLSLVENDFKKLQQFRQENSCALSTWLTIISVRRTIDFLRKDKRHLNAEPAAEDQDIWNIVPDITYKADRLLEQKQADESLQKSLASLSPRDGMIFDLLYKKGVSPEDAARTLGLSTNLIYSRKHRIIEKIRQNMSRV